MPAAARQVGWLESPAPVGSSAESGTTEPFSERLRQDADALWRAQHQHPFVQGIADGSLPIERFRHFIKQDYLYLIDYARVFSLAAAWAPTVPWAERLAELAHETLHTELALHRGLAEEWGIPAAELAAVRPTPTTRSYTDFLLRTASLGDFAEIVAALLPCMWGYSELGLNLAAGPRPAVEPYARWIDLYASPELADLAAWCRSVVDEVAAGLDRPRRDRMREAFLACSRLELAFWEASWRLEAAEG